LSSLYAERSAERDRQARELFFRGLDKLLFITAGLGVGFWLLAEPLLAGLYGASFTPAATTLRIFVLAALAANVVNPYTFVLQAQDEVARFVPLNLARLALYLIWLAVLVPEPSALGVAWLPAGDAGAAAARLLLIVVLSWVYVGWTRELAGIPFYRPALLYVAALAAGVVAGGLAGALAARAGAPAPAGHAVAAGAGLAAYLGVLLAVHPRTRQNLRDARALLSVREFRALVRGGFRPG
ncbi:MAG TPA: hypothetical protein VFX28_07545, partial [Methylomirabilota bacterium]|nr:hypothetical protein [Methylomirabilota bacterium]